MKPSFGHIAGLVALLAAAGPAQAQRITSPFQFIDTKQEIGAYAATVSADKGAVGLGSESGPAFGVRYGLRVSGPFIVEADVMYFPTQNAVLDTVVVDSAFNRLDTADQTLIVTTASFRLNLTGARTWHRLWPFVAFGGGAVIQTRKDTQAIDKAPLDARYALGTSFAGMLGAGVEFFPSSHVSVRVDGRNLLWKVKTPAALLRTGLGATMPSDEWVHNLTASAGVSIHF